MTIDSSGNKTSWQRLSVHPSDVAGTSQMKQLIMSRWNVKKISQWCVSTTCHWNAVTTSQEELRMTSHEFVPTTSQTNLK